MNAPETSGWRASKRFTDQDIIDAVKEKLKKTITWGKDPVCGFPTISPLPVGIEVFNMVQAQHVNAILCHTRSKGEKGFDGIKDLEREVVYMTADLCGVDPKKIIDGIDGYIASGGTEANEEAIWIGREKLRATIQSDDSRVAVITSPARHYSVDKGCRLTDIGVGVWEDIDQLNEESVWRKYIPRDDGSGLHLVRSSDVGEINVAQLSIKIRLLFEQKGIRRFIIVLNEGTTMTGAMDDTNRVGQLITDLRNEWKGQAEFYLHVDAAYGAFVYPFLDPGGKWGFRVPEVDSLTADPYKMGKCPIAEGVFLCKKGLMDHIAAKVGYVQNQEDTTLCGSRSGAYAAACWAVFHKLGFKGFQKLHLASAKRAQELHSKFIRQVPQIGVLDQQLNMVAITLPFGLDEGILKKVKEEIIDPYHLMWSWFTPDPEGGSIPPKKLVKFNITPDVKQEWLDEIANLFKKILQ